MRQAKSDRRIGQLRVAELTGLSVRTVQRRALDGRHGFPPGIKIPDAGFVFSESAVLAWIEERAAETDVRRRAGEAS